MFLQVIEDVRSWFDDREITAKVAVGAAAKNEQTNHDPADGRVVFVPSDDFSCGPPMFLGDDDESPRQLLNTKFAYEVTFTGYDSTDPENDLSHRRECYALFEATEQAIQRSYGGNYEWGSGRWEDARKYGRFGAELVVSLTINVPLLDVVSPSALANPVPGEPKPVDP